jgi:hypothetical protein
MNTALNFAVAALLLGLPAFQGIVDPPRQSIDRTVEIESRQVCRDGETLTDFALSGDGKSIAYICHQRARGKVPGDPRIIEERSRLLVRETQAGHPREVAGARFIHLWPSPLGQIFAAFLVDSKAKLITVSGRDVSGSFDVETAHGQGVWNESGSRFFFDAGTSKMAEDFNRLGILNLAKMTVSTKRLRAFAAHLAYCQEGARLLLGVSQGDRPSSSEEYDENGEYRKTSAFAGPVSATCRYSASWPSDHGPVDWAIYENKSGSQVLKYVWNDGSITDQRAFGGWNPRFDHLFLIYNDGEEKEEVYDLERHAIVRSYPGLGPCHWAPDGRSVVLFRGSEFLFEPI